MSRITSITYKYGKIITQRVLGVELDYDPSEGQKSNWEDYKRLAQTEILNSLH